MKGQTSKKILLGFLGLVSLSAQATKEDYGQAGCFLKGADGSVSKPVDGRKKLHVQIFPGLFGGGRDSKISFRGMESGLEARGFTNYWRYNGSKSIESDTYEAWDRGESILSASHSFGNQKRSKAENAIKRDLRESRPVCLRKDYRRVAKDYWWRHAEDLTISPQRFCEIVLEKTNERGELKEPIYSEVSPYFDASWIWNIFGYTFDSSLTKSGKAKIYVSNDRVLGSRSPFGGSIKFTDSKDGTVHRLGESSVVQAVNCHHDDMTELFPRAGKKDPECYPGQGDLFGRILESAAHAEELEYCELAQAKGRNVQFVVPGDEKSKPAVGFVRANVGSEHKF